MKMLPEDFISRLSRILVARDTAMGAINAALTELESDMRHAQLTAPAKVPFPSEDCPARTLRWGRIGKDWCIHLDYADARERAHLKNASLSVRLEAVPLLKDLVDEALSTTAEQLNGVFSATTAIEQLTQELRFARQSK